MPLPFTQILIKTATDAVASDQILNIPLWNVSRAADARNFGIACANARSHGAPDSLTPCAMARACFLRRQPRSAPFLDRPENTRVRSAWQ